MADLLGATNPVPGYDGAANRGIPISPNDQQVKNVPDPTRVIRPDSREEQQDAGDAAKSGGLRYDSNLQTFLQRLRDTPSLTNAMARLFMMGQGTVVSSGVGEGLAAELSRFMEMLHMDEGSLRQFLSGQMQAGARFGGALFSLLRSAYAGTQSQAMREDILQFLKKYSDFSSTKHIEGNILRNVSGMTRAIPSSFAGRLTELLAQLQNGVAAGDRAGNLKLLQGQIIPYMSDYVDRTHDMGHARSLLSFLMLDIARYENGSEKGLTQAFRQLSGYGALRDTLGRLTDEDLLRLLRTTGFAKASQADAFANSFAEAAARALRGEGGTEMQDTFREMVKALLINESVYMPINHMMIPAEWDGRMMFSELWVDPDAEDKAGRDGEQEGAAQRLLIKMDIQGLGFFDVVLTCQGGKVSMQVGCPERVAPFSQLISGSLADILKRNGLEPEAVQVARMRRPVTISEVFPKIFDGRGGVNVKV